MATQSTTLAGYTLTSMRKYREVKANNPDADEQTLLAKYDRRMGAIFDQDGVKVPNGTFSNAQSEPQAEYTPPTKTKWNERKASYTKPKAQTRSYKTGKKSTQQ